MCAPALLELTGRVSASQLCMQTCLDHQLSLWKTGILNESAEVPWYKPWARASGELLVTRVTTGWMTRGRPVLLHQEGS